MKVLCKKTATKYDITLNNYNLIRKNKKVNVICTCELFSYMFLHFCTKKTKKKEKKS